MKRWFSTALMLALLCTAMPTPTLAEEAPDEVVAPAAETSLEADGLFVDTEGDEVIVLDIEDEAPVAAEEIPETFAASYARVSADGAAVYAAADAADPFATIPAQSAVLLTGGAAQGREQVAFFTGELIVEGFIDAGALAPMGDDEVRAYMDTAASGIAVALYGDDLGRPLVPVKCAFAGEAAEDPTPEPTAEPTVEPTAKPTAEPTPAPTAEPTVEPTAKPTAEPTVEPTIEPTAKPTVEPTAEPTPEPTEAPLPVPEMFVMAPEAVEVADPAADSADAGDAAVQALAAKATGIELNRSSVAIGVGETYAGLSVKALPEGSPMPEITWRSANSRIAIVSADGRVYGRKKGVTTVYARMADGPEVACAITVLKAPAKVYVSPASLNLSAGGMQVQLAVAVNKKAASGLITFSSSDESVASVTAGGLVTGLKAGNAVITVKSYNGKKAYCSVRVVDAPARLTFPAETQAIGVGQKLGMAATAHSASGASVPAGITYAVGNTNDPGCVAIDTATGEITAARKGQALITATAHNGVVGRCIVNVVAAPEAVTLSAGSVTIGKKELYAGLTAALTAPAGENTCAGSKTWTNSNAKVAAVNQKGEIYGRKTGVATITATTHNGKSARCRVTVVKAPKKVYLSPASLNLSAGGMLAQLKTAVTRNAASGRIAFSSSDPSVAAVDANGLVTALKAGSAVITASSFNGKKAYCKVKVSEAPATAAFSAQSFTIGAGQKLPLEVAARSASGAAVPAGFTYDVSSDCVALDAAAGTITGATKGQAVITATTHNGVVAGCSVNVVAAPAGVSLNAAALTIGKKELYAGLAATLTAPAGENACAGTITWSTSNARVLAVDQQGRIYGRKAGAAYVYATTHNGKYARCRVVVKGKPSRIVISPVIATLKAGESGQYLVRLNKGAGGTITWTSSDTTVAVVDANGKVTALKKGTAYITAATYNGKKAISRLTVSSTAVSLPTNEYASVESTTSTYNKNMSNAEKLEYVIYVAQTKYGAPYVYGAFGPSKFDCSGFAYYCFKQIGVTLKTSAYSQGYDSRFAQIDEPKDLKRGDLVFFNTNDGDNDLCDHSGIYMGNGYFIHASSSAQKVIISQFVSKSSNYYQRTFSWGRRVLN